MSLTVRSEKKSERSESSLINMNTLWLQVVTLVSFERRVKEWNLQNVAVANALQRKAANATQVLFRFNYDAMPSLKSLTELSPLPNYSVFAADTLLFAVTLTSDLEHLQCVACDVAELCTKFERNLAIGGGVIAISVFDLMTLSMCFVLRSAIG